MGWIKYCLVVGVVKGRSFFSFGCFVFESLVGLRYVGWDWLAWLCGFGWVVCVWWLFVGDERGCGLGWCLRIGGY